MPSTVSLGNGILVEGDDNNNNGFKMRLDPRAMAEGTCFVSHAHSDHIPSSIAASGCGIVCSDETFRMLSILGLGAGRAMPGNVALLDAGHIVGSRMAAVEVGGKKILYTGDFNVRSRYFLEGAKPAKCDVLIMESTYSSKECAFPKVEEIERRVGEWLAKTEKAVLLGYNLGKAQILTAMANSLGYVPACQHSVFAANRLVEGLGHKLGRFERYSPFSSQDKSSGVVIATPDLSDPDIARLAGQGFEFADFTGWAALHPKTGRMAFPLSDHCGFDELLGFVRSCSPEKIFLVHGRGDALQNELEAGGWDVGRLSRSRSNL